MKMRAKFLKESISFERGIGSKKGLVVGIEKRLQDIINGRKLISNNDFDDDLLVYTLEDVYHKWKIIEPQDINNIEVWSDKTSSGSPIIKWKNPLTGRKKTLLSIDRDEYMLVGDQIVEFLKSPEYKNGLIENLRIIHLEDMIRRKLHSLNASILSSQIKILAKRLVGLLKDK